MKRIYNAPSIEETTITTHISICSGVNPYPTPERDQTPTGSSFAPKHA